MKPTLAQIDGYLRIHGLPSVESLHAPIHSRVYFMAMPCPKRRAVRRKWRVRMRYVDDGYYSVQVTRYDLTRANPPRPHYEFTIKYGHDLVMLAAVLGMHEWGSLWEPLSRQLRSQ